MSKRWFTPASFLVAVFVMLAGFGANAAAQGAATPTMSGSMGDTTPHPAHIHKGTCDTLGDVVFPLNNLVAPGMEASPVAGTEASPVASPVPGGSEVVSESTTTVKVALDDIISGGHAINVHESMENIQNYIACGDVTGTATGGQLQINLKELNGSGYMGQATLKDNGDGTTIVTVMLMHTGAATPAA